MDEIDDIDDIQVQGAIFKKVKVMGMLVVLLSTLVTFIVASFEEARIHKHKRRRSAYPLYKRIIQSSNTDCHDQLCMIRAAFFHLAEILKQ